jgi:pimeloyl-ACP methyl ester carboxylesterase
VWRAVEAELRAIAPPALAWRLRIVSLDMPGHGWAGPPLRRDPEHVSGIPGFEDHRGLPCVDDIGAHILAETRALVRHLSH